MQASPGTLTLLLAGDVMTGRGIDQVLAHPASPELYEPLVRDARDYVRMAERVNGPIPAPVPGAYLWGEALTHIGRLRPAACIVNLETALTAAGQPWPGKGIHYRMHPDNVGCLLAAQVDACALANNHTLDWGRDGLADTLRSLADAGLHGAGAGSGLAQAWAPAVLPLGAQRLLVFSCAAPDCGVPAGWAATPSRPGIALLKDLSEAGLHQVTEAVARERRDGDLVLLSIHWGANWVAAVPPAHRRFAHALIDGGLVDLVHGHSAHHPLPFEVHAGKLVLYGCGDLVNDYEGIEALPGYPQDLGCLFFATLSPSSGQLAGLRIVPLLRRAFQLVPASRAVRTAAWQALGVRPQDDPPELHWRPDRAGVSPPGGA